MVLAATAAPQGQDARSSAAARKECVIKFFRCLIIKCSLSLSLVCSIYMFVNRVVHHQCSSAHAEVMALSLAQQILGSFDLGATGMVEHQLVVNWCPCAMCYGAVVWSGVRSLVVAGSGPELEAITGFDEGPIHPDWIGQLEHRGIVVTDGVRTEAAIQVFKQFRDSGALVYNGRQGGRVDSV